VGLGQVAVGPGEHDEAVDAEFGVLLDGGSVEVSERMTVTGRDPSSAGRRGA